MKTICDFPPESFYGFDRGLWESECIEGAARGDGNVFLSIHSKGYGRGIDGATHLEVPERFAGGRVQGDEVSFGVAREHQASSSRQHARPRRRGVLELPLDRSGCGINRLQKSAIGLALFRGKIRAAIIRVAGFVGLWRSTEHIALIAARDIQHRSLPIAAFNHEARSSQPP